MALPRASARRSWLFPECVRRLLVCWLQARDRAIIREVNDNVFALNFLETGGIGYSESCEKVEYSIFSKDLLSPALHRLHSVISNFRPPSGVESGGDCSLAVPLEFAR